MSLYFNRLRNKINWPLNSYLLTHLPSMYVVANKFNITSRSFQEKASLEDLKAPKTPKKGLPVCASKLKSYNHTSTQQKNQIANTNRGPLDNHSNQKMIMIRKGRINQENPRLKTTYRYRQSKGSFHNGEEDYHRGFYGGRQTASRTQRQTQRDKFIKDLQSKVIDSHNDSFLDNLQQSFAESKQSRVWLGDQKCRSYAKSSNSFVDLPFHETSQEKQNHLAAVLNPKDVVGKIDKDKVEISRNRSRTLVKDFSKLVEDNLALKREDSKISKTIELNPFQTKARLSRSLQQLQRTQNHRQVSSKGLKASINVVKIQAFSPEEESKALDVQSKAIQEGTVNDSSGYEYKRNDTEVYQEQVKQLTDDFLTEWQKMNSNKSQLYEKLRNQLVRQYPKMRKKYSKYDIPPEAEPENHRKILRIKAKRSVSLMSPGLQSSMHISFKRLQSQSSDQNYLTTTQIRQKSTQQAQQQRSLKQIFKQAYFYSKTKKKHYNVNYEDQQREMAQRNNIGNIHKNMTFMNYVTRKNWKKNTNQRPIKGTNIVKHKQSILRIEKEGSPEQIRLKKNLEDAIQTCIRENR